MEYRVLTSRAIHSTLGCVSKDDALEDMVNLAIQEGWITKGGIGVSMQNGNIRYYQAMIKKD